MSKELEDLKKQFSEGDKETREGILNAVQRVAQRWLPDDDFTEQFEAGKKMARERGDDELSMCFIINFSTTKEEVPEEDRKKSALVVLPDWNPKNDEEKQKMMMGLGAKMADEHPDHMLVSVVHVSEAWMVQKPKDTDITKLKVMPRDDPDRIEVVLVHAMSIDQRQSFWQGKIIKNEDGTLKEIEDLMEDVHDPSKPKLLSDPGAMRGYLPTAILAGYFMAKDPTNFFAGRKDAKKNK